MTIEQKGAYEETKHAPPQEAVISDEEERRKGGKGDQQARKRKQEMGICGPEPATQMFSQTILSDNANALRPRTDLNPCRLPLSFAFRFQAAVCPSTRPLLVCCAWAIMEENPRNLLCVRDHYGALPQQETGIDSP